MGIPSVFQTGHSSLKASKAGIATAGHNISNANRAGFSRQRVDQSTNAPSQSMGKAGYIGRGTLIDRVGRINDTYLEGQITRAGRDLSYLEEKGLSLKQLEDTFNEMGGEGLNRIMTKFFSDFRDLSNDPQNEAIRQSVQESSKALISDFKRIRSQVEDIRKHIDARLEGYVGELNQTTEELKKVNLEVQRLSAIHGPPNDLLDKRDELVKKVGSFFEISTHEDTQGLIGIDVVGVGPLVTGPLGEKFFVERGVADAQGKPENALDVKTTAHANSVVTHQLKGGKMGALLEVRDQTLGKILEKLDSLAFNLSKEVNSIHTGGFARDGTSGNAFFNSLAEVDRAAEKLDLSDAVNRDIGKIATALEPGAPGDNRVAIAISQLQDAKLMGNGQATMDQWFNSIVGDVGVNQARTQSALEQQRGIREQLGKMRDSISGVSIDEETTNILQYQQIYDASAKMIQVANQMLDTVLQIGRS